MTSPDPAALVVAAAEEIVAAIAPEAERLTGFRRRFILTLHDRQLLDVVGRDWVRIGSGCLEFGNLPFHRADELLRRLQGRG